MGIPRCYRAGKLGFNRVTLVIFLFDTLDLDVGPLMDSAVVTLGTTDSLTQPFNKLECTINPSNASVTARWLYGGEVIDSNNASSRFYMRAFVQSGNIINEDIYGTLLLLHALSYEDAGTYTCQAKRSGPDSEWCSGSVELKLEGMEFCGTSLRS